MTTTPVLPDLPAIVSGAVSHARHGEVAHRFRHRAYQWLVDLDDAPRVPRALRPFVRFRARDHLGTLDDGGLSAIKRNVETFLAANGVDLGPGARILMLANARVLGYVFDPLTVYWCLDADGVTRRLVAEVHNTYGQRTAYLLTPDERGQAEVDKHFYVSPFNDVSGRYRMRFVLEESRIAVSIVLEREAHQPFSASFTGIPRAATPGRVARVAMLMPLMPQRVSALIAIHGIWLWLRRLPVVPRPAHTPPQEV